MVQEQKSKVLLIEDDIFMGGLLFRALDRAGFEVAVARTGGEGIKQFQETQPQVILLDLLLPDENGLEVLRKIRRSEGGPAVKVIVLSNLSRESNFEEARRLGALDYLVKVNFSLDEIVAKVRSVL